MDRRSFISLIVAVRGVRGWGQTVAPEDRIAIEGFINGGLSPFHTGYYAGHKVLLETERKGDFAEKLNSVAKGFDPNNPTVVFIVDPPMDKQGGPKPQLALASGFIQNVAGKDYDVVFATRYLTEGLKQGQLLAVLAHECGHFRQMREYQREHPDDRVLKHFRLSRKLESDADALSLSCPEVDPLDFKDMIIAIDKLNDEAGRRHPFLLKGGLGTTKLIPFSMQTKLEMGGNHPTSGSRIRAAENEMKRRAAGDAQGRKGAAVE
jgi:hypothetical protein